MATNFVQSGDVVTVVSPAGGVTANDPVLIGVSLFGVATHTAAAAADLELALTGVWDLPSDNTITFTAGDRVYWDPGNGEVDKTLAAQTCIGVATVTSVNQTTARVRIGLADLAGG